MSAACVKANASGRPEEVELADLFCRQASLRAERLFAELWDNTDDVDVAAAKRVTSGRYLAPGGGRDPAPGRPVTGSRTGNPAPPRRPTSAAEYPRRLSSPYIDTGYPVPSGAPETGTG
jgi:hypothetical protein